MNRKNTYIVYSCSELSDRGTVGRLLIKSQASDLIKTGYIKETFKSMFKLISLHSDQLFP